jgi:hypothetical protein
VAFNWLRVLSAEMVPFTPEARLIQATRTFKSLSRRPGVLSKISRSIAVSRPSATLGPTPSSISAIATATASLCRWTNFHIGAIGGDRRPKRGQSLVPQFEYFVRDRNVFQERAGPGLLFGRHGPAGLPVSSRRLPQTGREAEDKHAAMAAPTANASLFRRTSFSG